MVRYDYSISSVATRMKKTVRIILWSICFILCVLLFALIVYGYEWYQASEESRQEAAKEVAAIDDVLSARRAEQAGTDEDPFGDDDLVRVLFIGLDSRAGQEHGHCDAIQMIEINKAEGDVSITAVPRGTYSPLPPGTGTTSTDYYVSNSCALGGLEYGINNIEHILGKKADYLVLVGFSETFGILRSMQLPTTETLQWLRNRQGYAIGEPQRARNHSTFIKQMMVRFLGDEPSRLDKTFHYILYTMVHTDLSYAQGEEIVDALAQMDLADHPERITLSMKPAYSVQDIAYDPEHITEHLDATLGRISKWLNPKDYSGQTEEDIQGQLLTTIEEQKEDPEFIKWAYENDLWLQVDDDALRPQIRWDLMLRYFDLISKEEKQAILADYVIEMEHLGNTEWEQKGRALILAELEESNQ